jgi:hypothetical protein
MIEEGKKEGLKSELRIINGGFILSEVLKESPIQSV